MTVLNTTISNNSTAVASVDTRGGGGIFNAGRLTLTNATVTGNSTTNGRPGRNAFLGGGILNLGSVRLANTIISGNVAGGGGNECSGSLTSVGSNLIRSLAGCTLTGVTTGNLIGIDPKLGPLQNNGGRTATEALLSGSPAIDAVTTGNCPPTDQRGVARPQDGNGDGRAVCDIGAFEVQPPVTFGSLCTLSRQLVTNGSLAAGMCRALEQAQRAKERGLPDLKAKLLTTYAGLVDTAQRVGAVTAAQAVLLKSQAATL
jgi:hypothetical protein